MNAKTNTIAAPFEAASLPRGAIASGLFGSATLSVLDQAVMSATRFAVCVLIGRLCGQEQLGIYYFVASIVLFALGIQEQIIRAPFAVYGPQRSGQELRTYTGSLLLHQLLLSAICVIAILGCGATALITRASPELITSLFALAIVATPWLGREFVRAIAIGHLDIRSLLIVDACVAMLQLSGLALLASTGLLTVTSAFVVLGGSCALVCAGWLGLKRQTIRFETSGVATDWQHNWNFSRWALTTHVLSATAPIIVTWVLAATHGSAATGKYAACMTIVGLAWVVVGGLQNLAVPRATRAFVDRGAAGVRKAMYATAIMLALPSATFVVFSYFAADRLAIFIYGGKFNDCGDVVTVLGLWMLATGFTIASGSSLWAIGHARANLPADVVAFVLTAILACVGAIWFGIIGAAWAMFFGSLAGSSIRWVTATRRIANLLGT